MKHLADVLTRAELDEWVLHPMACDCRICRVACEAMYGMEVKENHDVVPDEY